MYEEDFCDWIGTLARGAKICAAELPGRKEYDDCIKVHEPTRPFRTIATVTLSDGKRRKLRNARRTWHKMLNEFDRALLLVRT